MSEALDDIKHSVVHGTLWKFAERTSSQLVTLIVTIVISRILMPSDYGIISMVTIFITLANVFVSDGFGVALIQKKDADQVDFSTVFYFGLVFSVGLYIFIYCIGAHLLADFYNMPLLVLVLRIMSVSLPIASINSVQQAYVSRHMIFKNFFFSSIIGTTVSAIVGIAMALMGFGVWALVAQYLTNCSMNTLVLWVRIKWRPKRVFSFSRLKILFSYGWKLLVQSLLVQLYGNLRTLVIGKVYTASDLAYYDRGSYYPNLLVTNIDTAISSTLFPAMSKEQNNVERVKAIAKRTTKSVSYLLSPALIGLAACAEPLITIILTDKWLPIVPIFRIVCINLLFRAPQTATLQAIKAIGRSDLVLKMDIPVRLLGIVTLLITLRYGTIYIAMSEFVVTVFGFIVYGFVCGKVLGYHIPEIILDFGGNVLMSFCMGICVFTVGQIINTSVILTLLIEVVVGVVVYIGISLITRNENFFYIYRERKVFIPKKH